MQSDGFELLWTGCGAMEESEDSCVKARESENAPATSADLLRRKQWGRGREFFAARAPGFFFVYAYVKLLVVPKSNSSRHSPCPPWVNQPLRIRSTQEKVSVGERKPLMRFEFYHSGIENEPKLSVDGTVPKAIHFSHWKNNETPYEVKADTSTEIALNLVASPHRKELTQGVELVTNNHFDTDGVLSVWTVLKGQPALAFNDKLIPAAEAGDFSEYSTEDGIRISIAIQGSEQASRDSEAISPLASFVAGQTVNDEARAYELVLPEVETLLSNTAKYEHLWSSGWQQIVRSCESFERGTSKVQEFPDLRLSLIEVSPDIFQPQGFDPTRHNAPFTAISRYARGSIFLIVTPFRDGWIYRLDYPYYSWAETLVRPSIQRRDLTSLLSQLNAKEPNRDGLWSPNSSELTSAVKFLDEQQSNLPSLLRPDEVMAIVRSELLSQEPATAVISKP